MIETTGWELIGTFTRHQDANQIAFDMSMTGCFMRISTDKEAGTWSVWKRKEVSE